MAASKSNAVLAALKRVARRLLSGLLRFLLRLRSRPWPARPPGRPTLIFAPHQDDCALGCGGLIALRREAGEIVHIAYITDGSASHPGHPRITPAELSALRMEEARTAGLILGVPSENLYFLGAPDSRLPHLENPARRQLVANMRRLIDELRPSEVLVTSQYDGSSEHTAARALVGEAVTGSAEPPRLVEYLVWACWNPRPLWRALRAGRIVHRAEFSCLAARKQSAIAAYRSQIAPIPPWTKPLLSTEFLSFFKTSEEFFFEI